MKPSNALMKYHLTLNQASAAVIEAAIADPTEVGSGHERINQLDQWSKALKNRPEAAVLRNAISEAALGEFLLVSGLYRPAFASLRLFLEMSFAAIHFSANRIELTEWLQGRKDVVWSALIDAENGVLSRRYADAFFPALRASVDSHNTVAGKVYRNLSEYVHGNSNTWEGSAKSIELDSLLQEKWIQHMEDACTVVEYALVLRFLKEIDLKQTPALAETINSSLGHIEALREFLSK